MVVPQMTLRGLAIALFRTLIRYLDFIWPKDSRLLIFGSRGGAYPAGNSKAVFEYIQTLSDTPFKCYYMLNHKSTDSQYLCNRHPSLKTIRIFLRAKTILMTNSMDDMANLRPSHRKNVIHLWHGQGPKADGYATKKFTKEMLQDSDFWHQYTTAFVTCSRLDSYMRAYAHALHATQILPVGYPRCDYLLEKERWKTRIPSLFEDLPEYQKVVLYATTWRTDGAVRFFPFDDFSNSELEEWCDKHKILLLVRSHEGDKGEVEESSHVRNLSFKLQPEVDEILPEVDLLINDYSSIQSDFMLLDRPMIFVPYDMDKFLTLQDFCYPNYDFWCPGQKVYTFREFKNAIEQALFGDDPYAEQRRLVNGLINEFQTPGATQRVYDYLIELLGFKKV
jgi:CDP-glycerol glycerophosphotransferase (TagB/SpsB family)